MCTENKQDQEVIAVWVWPDGFYQEVEPGSEPPSYMSDDYKTFDIPLSDLDEIAEKASGKTDPIDIWVSKHLDQMP